jgi:hypothetical protein
VGFWGGSFTIWPAFRINGGGCDVIPSLQGFMFILVGGVENRANPIMSWVSINPLFFVMATTKPAFDASISKMRMTS